METRSSIVLPTKYPCSMLYQLKYTFTKHKYCGCLQNCKPFSPVTVAVKMALPGWIMVPFSPQWRKWPEVGTGTSHMICVGGTKQVTLNPWVKNPLEVTTMEDFGCFPWTNSIDRIHQIYPLVNSYIAIENCHLFIVELPIKNSDFQ